MTYLVHFGNKNHKRTIALCGAPRSSADTHRVEFVSCETCLHGLMQNTNKHRKYRKYPEIRILQVKQRLEYIQSKKQNRITQSERALVEACGILEALNHDGPSTGYRTINEWKDRNREILGELMQR